MLVRKIISGGQTGADRGGLEAAITLGIPHGGWCPTGRRAEDGKIPARYELQETEASDYQVRTKRNVFDADATVIFTDGPPTGGSLLTARVAGEASKPWLHLDVASVLDDQGDACARLRAFLEGNRVATLNVAGSRESMRPGIETIVRQFLEAALTRGVPYSIDEESPLPMAADGPAGYSAKSTRRRPPR